jgi:hypothetical protein
MCLLAIGQRRVRAPVRGAEHARTRWSSDGLEKALAEGGFPSPKSADLTILELHAVEPPL